MYDSAYKNMCLPPQPLELWQLKKCDLANVYRLALAGTFPSFVVISAPLPFLVIPIPRMPE